jgi:hypothetical protein
MKKLLMMGALAVALLAASQQQASAWRASKFGVGLNWEYSSGGNCFGWGLWRNGQPPGPDYSGHGHGGYGHGGYGFAPMPNGYGMPHGYGMDYGAPPPGSAPDFMPPAPRPADGQAWQYFPPMHNGAYYVPVNWYR